MINIFNIVGIFLLMDVLPFLKENIKGLRWLTLFFALSILTAILRILLSGGISEFTQIIKIGTIAIFLLLWFKNKTQSGFLLAIVGLVSNTLVIFLNGGMPVFLNLNSNLILPVGYLIANDQTILAILSDWIPGLFWEEYGSPGDYLFASAPYVFWLQNREKIEKVYWPP